MTINIFILAVFWGICQHSAIISCQFRDEISKKAIALNWWWWLWCAIAATVLFCTNMKAKCPRGDISKVWAPLYAPELKSASHATVSENFAASAWSWVTTWPRLDWVKARQAASWTNSIKLEGKKTVGSIRENHVDILAPQLIFTLVYLLKLNILQIEE